MTGGKQVVPDYQLEDTKRQAAMERQQREPKEHCFKCGKEIEPEELIEYYDLAFCSQGCLDQAMQCPECGEPAEEVGGYCAGCAEKNRIYTMSDAEFWEEVDDVVTKANLAGNRVIRQFDHQGDVIDLMWSCRKEEPILELTALFESRGIEYKLGDDETFRYLRDESISMTSITIKLVAGNSGWHEDGWYRVVFS
jgi:hypothetical protein